MKSLITTLCLVFTLTACGQDKIKNMDTQTLTWGGKAAVGSYAPEGTLEVKNITSEIDGKTIRSLNVTIDMKSLSQENERLTKHLRDKDFFHVKKYPEATFVLSAPFQISVDKVLKGKMTIKDKTQEEVIPVQVTMENGTITLVINHTMNRLDYGITYNSPSVFEKLKENAIADEIILKGTLRITAQ